MMYSSLLVGVLLGLELAVNHSRQVCERSEESKYLSQAVALVVLTGKQSGPFGHRVWLWLCSAFEVKTAPNDARCSESARGWGSEEAVKLQQSHEHSGHCWAPPGAAPAAWLKLVFSHSNSWNASSSSSQPHAKLENSPGNGVTAGKHSWATWMSIQAPQQ